MSRDRKSDKHRPALERKLGRKLGKGEVAHHVDEDKTNDAPANLAPQSRRDHTTAHNRGRAVSRLRESLRMPRDKKKLY